MEKLIKLLNEYRVKELGESVKEWEERELCYTDEIIISKKFGFIKWLVDNDKIDTAGKITEDLTYEYFQIPRKYFRGGKYTRLSEEMNDIFYHRILACISIQDTPIEFLISILK